MSLHKAISGVLGFCFKSAIKALLLVGIWVALLPFLQEAFMSSRNRIPMPDFIFGGLLTFIDLYAPVFAVLIPLIGATYMILFDLKLDQDE
ncbi:hypothetical protein ACYPKM_04730 [Pseudomonas aeruginosa]